MVAWENFIFGSLLIECMCVKNVEFAVFYEKTVSAQHKRKIVVGKVLNERDAMNVDAFFWVHNGMRYILTVDLIYCGRTMS